MPEWEEKLNQATGKYRASRQRTVDKKGTSGTAVRIIWQEAVRKYYPDIRTGAWTQKQMAQVTKALKRLQLPTSDIQPFFEFIVAQWNELIQRELKWMRLHSDMPNYRCLLTAIDELHRSWQSFDAPNRAAVTDSRTQKYIDKLNSKLTALSERLKTLEESNAALEQTNRTLAADNRRHVKTITTLERKLARASSTKKTRKTKTDDLGGWDD